MELDNLFNSINLESLNIKDLYLLLEILESNENIKEEIEVL